MNDYFEIKIILSPCPGEDATDLLAGMLGDVGFESFVPDDTGVTAYIKADIYNEDDVKAVLSDFPFNCAASFSATLIKGQDWNSEWERHYFQPIVIEDKCVIHSSFHTDIPTAQYDIVIDPKMAFGTGHHSTTSLIIRQILSHEIVGRSVIDMGTGTGILAILAAMRGALPIHAVEIDESAVANAVENVATNGHPEIVVIHGDASVLADILPADFFIANINRNVITSDLPTYVKAIKKGGIALFSGFYVDDIEIIKKAAEQVGLRFITFTEDNNWACTKFIKDA